jgi:hypothetical protein
MRSPRFKVTNTSKGWRLNIPAGLSASGRRARRFFATREAAEGAATKLRAQFVDHGLAARLLSSLYVQAAARAFAILGASTQPTNLIEAAREYVERTTRVWRVYRLRRHSTDLAAQPRSPSYVQSLRQYKTSFRPSRTDAVRYYGGRN